MAWFTPKQIAATGLVFLMQFIYAGVFFSFAQYYPLLVDQFDSTYAFIGFIGTSVSGFSNFVSPISSALVSRFGYATVIPVAGLLVALAFILTSLETQAWQLFFSYSILFGASCGTISHLSLSFLLEVIETKKEVALAMGISNIGTGLGYISISCFVAYFANIHSILDCSKLFLCLSGTGFFIFLLSPLLCMVVPNDQRATGTNPSESVGMLCSRNKHRRNASNSSFQQIQEKVQRPHGWELLVSKDGYAARSLFISQIIGFSMTVIPFK